jgi:hypothetical protein
VEKTVEKPSDLVGSGQKARFFGLLRPSIVAEGRQTGVSDMTGR